MLLVYLNDKYVERSLVTKKVSVTNMLCFIDVIDVIYEQARIWNGLSFGKCPFGVRRIVESNWKQIFRMKCWIHALFPWNHKPQPIDLLENKQTNIYVVKLNLWVCDFQ